MEKTYHGRKVAAENFESVTNQQACQYLNCLFIIYKMLLAAYMPLYRIKWSDDLKTHAKNITSEEALMQDYTTRPAILYFQRTEL